MNRNSTYVPSDATMSMTSSATRRTLTGPGISPCQVRIRDVVPRSSLRRASLATTRLGFQWAIVHEGRASGGINLWIVRPDSAEIGYDIAHPLWGQGLVAEAAASVVVFGFEELGLARIQAVADIRNVASWRVMEKLGMQREGVARMNRLIGDERVDDVLYAVLRDEWQAREPLRKP